MKPGVDCYDNVLYRDVVHPYHGQYSTSDTCSELCICMYY